MGNSCKDKIYIQKAKTYHNSDCYLPVHKFAKYC